MPIGPIYGPLPTIPTVGPTLAPSTSSGTTSATGKPTSSAAGQFKSWLGQVDQLQGQAEKSSSQLVVGDPRSLHAVMIASEEASLALSTVLQVRTRALEAYQEIMRMQL